MHNTCEEVAKDDTRKVNKEFRLLLMKRIHSRMLSGTVSSRQQESDALKAMRLAAGNLVKEDQNEARTKEVMEQEVLKKMRRKVMLNEYKK